MLHSDTLFSVMCDSSFADVKPEILPVQKQSGANKEVFASKSKKESFLPTEEEFS